MNETKKMIGMREEAKGLAQAYQILRSPTLMLEGVRDSDVNGFDHSQTALSDTLVAGAPMLMVVKVIKY